MANNFFDERERAYLKTLQDNPIWASILKKMETFSKTPRYKRGVDEDIQVSNWKYESGRLDERETILSLLRLSKTKLDLEK